ncbi:MAG: protein-disulfide reductase DsbD, partial [Betaproteobacteria bacterium]|nr:protein-disulfide reductase DsbD [Betaproteobacteria bacterium]
ALSLAYSLGMALVYTLFGVAAGLAGEGLAGALQQPPVLIGFALLLTLLALSQFDLYTLQLPGGFMERITQASNRLRGGSLAPVFLMGGLSALMVGPCVAAPLAGALLYISQTHNVVTGGVALFSLASGMSLPLLALGLSAGTLLPRAGAWMNGVKQFFGQLLLGVALWMVSPLLPPNVLLALWGGWAMLGAIFLRVLERSEAGVSAARRFGQWAGVVLLVAGVFELAGAAVGSEDPLHPLEGFRVRESTLAQASAPGPRFQRIHSLPELNALIRGSARPVLLDFYADWCVSCKEMERLTFADPAVARVMQDYTLVQADVTANSEPERDLLRTFRLFGPPGILIFSAQGQEVPARRVIGFMKPAEFLTHLQPL